MDDDPMRRALTLDPTDLAEKEDCMLLIWGWRARYRTLDEGTFYCPKEGGDRTYRRKEARRWFTLFFIPLIPLKVLGEFVECQSCKSSYDPVVLTAPTAANILDNLANAMRYAVVAISRADGTIDDAERRVALEIMQQHSDTPYTEADLDRDLEELDTGSLTDQLSRVAGHLTEHGKERLLSACVHLAAADGSIDEAETRELQRAGSALGMSPAHIRGVIESAREASSQ